MKSIHLFPSYTRLERAADTIVHAAGVGFALAASAFLLIAAMGRVPALKFAGAAVYCLGLIVMFGASAAYNLVSHQHIKEVLRRLDHAAIFIMIAGSYTPFALAVDGAAGRFLLISVWAVAFIGVLIKLRFPRRLDKLSVLLYLCQGWIVLLAIDPLTAALPNEVLYLLLAGGIVYTLGVPFHLGGCVFTTLFGMRSFWAALPVNSWRSNRPSSNNRPIRDYCWGASVISSALKSW